MIASLVNAADLEHYVFPWHGKQQRIDPTRPITSWRSIRHKAARNDKDEVVYPKLERVRFHDLRHTALTVMAEKGGQNRL